MGKRRYKYVGPNPVSMPAFGLDGVVPGQIVETDEEINHLDFKSLTTERKSGTEKEEKVSVRVGRGRGRARKSAPPEISKAPEPPQTTQIEEVEAQK